MQTVQNNFNNHSGVPGDLYPGRSKFSEAQTEERLRVHAISIATGSPTIPQIVELWKEKFGIEIALQTCKSWRQSNRERIERKKMELIESGEIKVPVVSEEVLCDSMMELTIKTSRLSQAIQRKAMTTLALIETDGHDDFKAKEKNQERLEVFKALTDSLAKANKNIKDQLDSLFGFASKIKIKDKEVQKLVDKHFDEKMRVANEEDEDFEVVSDMEITDEMRKKLLED